MVTACYVYYSRTPGDPKAGLSSMLQLRSELFDGISTTLSQFKKQSLYWNNLLPI